MLPQICHDTSRYLTRILILSALIFFTTLCLTYNSKLHTFRKEKNVSHTTRKQMKYILQWPRRDSDPFHYMGQENTAFVKNKCKFTNCFVTDDNTYFSNRAKFDAIVFNGWDVAHLWPFQLPNYRIPQHKYIFGAMESADNYPTCDKYFDGFFNWTWTYKLDSDFRWGYLTIYDLNGTVVGPAIDMKWISEMEPISEDLKVKLSSKTKVAAWFVSHCSTKSGRELFVQEVQRELKVFGWTVDVYGACGPFKCPKSKKDSCLKKVEKDYHFYFALENSLSEDYVTEKLLTALHNYAVPVVFGGANYSR